MTDDFGIRPATAAVARAGEDGSRATAGGSSHPPAVVLSWAGRLAGLVDRASGGVLVGAYLHGSAVLGGWLPGRSDVDALFVTGQDLAPARLAAVTEALAGSAADCPGASLECSVVTAGQARQPGAPWPFVLHVQAGVGPPRIVRSSESDGDRDLLMHYAVCRAAGWPLHGPPPRELIGGIARPTILGYLADELDWGLDHAPEQYAVLNACRARAFAADGQIVSKITGGQTALRRGLGAADVIRRALDQQCGSRPEQAPAADAVAFVLGTAAALRAAAADPA